VPDGVSFPHSIDGAYESLLSFKEKKKKKKKMRKWKPVTGMEENKKKGRGKKQAKLGRRNWGIITRCIHTVPGANKKGTAK